MNRAPPRSPGFVVTLRSAIVWTSAVLLAAASPARAAQTIPPQTLRELVAAAEVIVVVRVREPTARDAGVSPPRDERLSWALLDVEQLLKGNPGVDSIRHLNGPAAAVPAPACYLPGSRALAFLTRTKGGPKAWAPDGLATVAFSYGSKMLDDDALALYVERVIEQLAIDAMAEGPERIAAQVDWLVRCAEQPATRWEGAYDLAPWGKSRAQYDPMRPAPWAAELSHEQRLRLLDAWMRADEKGRGEQCLEHLFEGDRDPRVLDWLVARFREAIVPAKGSGGSLRPQQLVREIARLDPRPRVAEIAARLSALDIRPRDPNEPPAVAAERRRLAAELAALYSP